MSKKDFKVGDIVDLPKGSKGRVVRLQAVVEIEGWEGCTIIYDIPPPKLKITPEMALESLKRLHEREEAERAKQCRHLYPDGEEDMPIYCTEPKGHRGIHMAGGRGGTYGWK